MAFTPNELSLEYKLQSIRDTLSRLSIDFQGEVSNLSFSQIAPFVDHSVEKPRNYYFSVENPQPSISFTMLNAGEPEPATSRDRFIAKLTQDIEQSRQQLHRIQHEKEEEIQRLQAQLQDAVNSGRRHETTFKQLESQIGHYGKENQLPSPDLVHRLEGIEATLRHIEQTSHSFQYELSQLKTSKAHTPKTVEKPFENFVDVRTSGKPAERLTANTSDKLLKKPPETSFENPFDKTVDKTFNKSFEKPVRNAFENPRVNWEEIAAQLQTENVRLKTQLKNKAESTRRTAEADTIRGRSASPNDTLGKLTQATMQKVLRQVMQEVGARNPHNIVERVRELQATHKQSERAKKFSHKVTQLAKAACPPGTFERDCSLKQVWKWIKRLTEDYLHVLQRNEDIDTPVVIVEKLQKILNVAMMEAIPHTVSKRVAEHQYCMHVLNKVKALFHLPSNAPLEQLESEVSRRL